LNPKGLSSPGEIQRIVNSLAVVYQNTIVLFVLRGNNMHD
jgi:hypothetical protein